MTVVTLTATALALIVLAAWLLTRMVKAQHHAHDAADAAAVADTLANAQTWIDLAVLEDQLDGLLHQDGASRHW